MVRLSCLLTCCLLGALLLVLPAASYPSSNNYYRDVAQYEPEDIAAMLSRLNDLIDMERKMESYKEEISRKVMPTEEKDDMRLANSKRDLDMGLNRGYSGALQAKHLLGNYAANFAGGPGRRRRNAH